MWGAINQLCWANWKWYHTIWPHKDLTPYSWGNKNHQKPMFKSKSKPQTFCTLQSKILGVALQQGLLQVHNLHIFPIAIHTTGDVLGLGGQRGVLPLKKGWFDRGPAPKDQDAKGPRSAHGLNVHEPASWVYWQCLRICLVMANDSQACWNCFFMSKTKHIWTNQETKCWTWSWPSEVTYGLRHLAFVHLVNMSDLCTVTAMCFVSFA